LRSARYRRLWLAQVLSEIGDWAARLALSALIYSRTGSASLSSLAFVIALLPALGPGPWLSTYADRYGRRLVMVGGDLIRALIFGLLALPLDWPPAVPLLMAMLAGVVTTPFESARAAAVIDVVEAGPEEGARRRVIDAVTLGQVTQDVATVLGYLVGGLLLVALGPAGGLAADAATFALSALLLAGLPPMVPAAEGARLPPSAGPGAATRPGASARLRAAAGAMTADPLVRRAALLASLAVATGTATQSLVVPLVTATMPARPWLSGAALAAGAGTALVATVVLPRAAAGGRALQLTAVLCLLPAAFGAGLAAAPSPWAALAGLVLTGGLFAALVPAVGLVAPRLPTQLRATCFGLLTALLTALQGVLCLAAGLIADTAGAARAAVVVLLPAAAAGVVVLVGPARSRPAPGRRRATRAALGTQQVVWTPATRHRLRSGLHGRSGWPLAVSRPAPQLYRLNGSALVVRGRPSRPGPGAVLGVAFWVELRPTTRQVLSHLLDPHAGVHPRSAVTGGLSVQAFEAAGLEDGRRALDAAVAVAARLLGEPFTLTGDGCLVDGVLDLTDTATLLPGDVIVRTGRGPTETAARLRRMLPDQGPATLGVRRPGTPGVLEVRQDRRDDGTWGFRASTHRQALRCGLDVSLDLPDGTFGPSLGLGVTLALLDLLGHRRPGGVTGGQHVAVTGAVLPDGRVCEVGGLVTKARAVACHPHVGAFVVPSSNAEELAAVRRVLPGRRVLPVGTVEEALDAIVVLSR